MCVYFFFSVLFSVIRSFFLHFFFFFNDTATTEIYTLSLHDALPICRRRQTVQRRVHWNCSGQADNRSEEHTSELQSQSNLVCRLLLEKKKHRTLRSLTQKNKILSVILRPRTS